MHEPFEIRGHWGLPEDPDNKVPGTLTFDPDDGANRELMGGLGGIEGVKKRTFSEGDTKHYGKVMDALGKAAYIMDTICDVTESHGSWFFAKCIRKN